MFSECFPRRLDCQAQHSPCRSAAPGANVGLASLHLASKWVPLEEEGGDGGEKLQPASDAVHLHPEPNAVRLAHEPFALSPRPRISRFGFGGYLSSSLSDLKEIG